MKSTSTRPSQETLETLRRACAGKRFAIAVASFHRDIADMLVDGARRALFECGVEEGDIDTFTVPGCFELPLASRTLVLERQYAAVVALGAIIRGETPHFDFIAAECARGIMTVQLETGAPIGFGVLTTENFAQAEERADPNRGDKGYDAAIAAASVLAVRFCAPEPSMKSSGEAPVEEPWSEPTEEPSPAPEAEHAEEPSELETLAQESVDEQGILRLTSDESGIRGEAQAVEDKTLTCKDCSKPFTFTASEQQFFAEKGFSNEPQRCKDCRQARRNSGGNGNQAARQSFEAVCAECGVNTTIPFRPRGDRPVYCRACYSAHAPAPAPA